MCPRLIASNPEVQLDGQNQSASSAFDRLVLILGVMLALSALVILPVGMVLMNNNGWDSLINVVWLILPAIALLASLREWLKEKRAGATADAIVACGVGCIWLLLVSTEIARLEEIDLGDVPYFAATGLLVLTILSFILFVRSVRADSRLAKSPTMAWLYWSLVVISIIVMAATYGLTLYFQILVI